MLNLPKSLQMRLCCDSDQGFMLSLYRSTRSDLLDMAAEPVLIEQLIVMQWQMQRQAYKNSYAEAEYWLILHDGCPIGRLVLTETVGQLHIVDIALLPSQRGCGYGKVLLLALQARATAAACAISLSVSHGNVSAQRLYARVGFVPLGSDAMQTHLRWQPTINREQIP